MERKRRPVVLRGLVLVAAIGLVLAAPTPALANLCAETGVPGDVIFIGKVVEAPPQGGPFHDVMGVYRFEIQEVFAGNPGDGRVWNPQGYGGGGVEFQFGGVYEVHAYYVQDGRTIEGARLSTDVCLANRLISASPFRMGDELVGWARVVLPLLVVVVLGIGLVAGILFGRVWLRRHEASVID